MSCKLIRKNSSIIRYPKSGHKPDTVCIDSHASAPLFHTDWVVESLVTQTLVLFISRTVGNPLRSQPSLPLAITVLLVVGFGMLLPFIPLAAPLGFTPLPALSFLFLAKMRITYYCRSKWSSAGL
jgi:magnesium-transporting ATPase (P-type)